MLFRDLNRANFCVLDRGDEMNLDEAIRIGLNVFESLIDRYIHAASVFEDIEVRQDLLVVDKDVKNPLARTLHIGFGELHPNLVLAG